MNAKLEKILTIITNNPKNDDQIVRDTEKASEAYLAIVFIMGADRARFRKYVEDLHNDYLKGINNHP